ncbi:MAG TPA: hypothetical protein VMP08_26570 [Anaerolineae bacterium]|nr:hypothetical protein [Anaerolineae bacterium]
MDTLLVLAGIVLLAITSTYFGVKSHKRRIREILSEKGATDIEVSWQWNWGDRANSVYTVVYTNRQDQRRDTICKVGRSFSLSGGVIYWVEPPEV